MEAGSWILSLMRLKIVLVFLGIFSVETRLFSEHLIHRMSINSQRLAEARSCQESCRFTLVESIPDNLTFSGFTPLMSTYAAHKRLLEKAQKTLHLASFYWTLTHLDQWCPDNSSIQGEDIFQTLQSLVKKPGMEVMIAQNRTNNNTDLLAKLGAQVRTLDFPRLMHAGVMHTKMWIVDESHIYIGSGNFDWRSYTQVKEIGVLIEDCPCLGQDAAKLFQVYWELGAPNATVPDKWPEQYGTDINKTNPLLVHYNDTQGQVYMSSSPPPFCPDGRTQDLDALLNVISSAKKFIYISVMDYFPMYIYTYPKPEIFWPTIDDALRKMALEHKVAVYLMASQWNHTDRSMKYYLKSLFDLHNTPITSKRAVNLQVKLFTVPSTPGQEEIAFARVSHSKYMVTDQHAYIGTSNWAGDYFTYTAGVSFVLQQPDDGKNGTNLRQQLVQVFLRDWNSDYAEYVDL